MSDRPAPLVAADVDLRDFQFMPLDVQRLRDSDLASDETPEACWAAVLLWCASWHQIPAASVPNNDTWLAKQCGYVAQGKVSPKWKAVRKGALRGWVECSDGRLYHPVVAEKAREAWKSKLFQRWRTECARVKKHNQRNSTNLRVPEFDDWLSLGCPQGQTLPVPEDKKECPRDVPRETPSKGQGQGQGQGSDLGERASAPPAKRKTRLPDDFALTPERRLSLATVNPQADAVAEFDQFCNHHRSRGNVMADWDAAWRTWCGNSVRFAARPARQGSLLEHNLAAMQEFVANGTD